MWTDLAVVFSPGFDVLPCIAQGEEPVGVETFVAEAAVEALDEAVLDGLAWANEPELDALFVGPLI